MSAQAQAVELYCSACERMFRPDVGDLCPRDGTRLVKFAPSVDPFIGLDLDGRYVIHDKLGQGGMGAVYRGTQRSVDREVAIKVVSRELMSEPSVVKRFLREARLASRINHPNAVSVVDFGQTSDGVFYLVMEMVAGRTLSAVLRADGALDPGRVVRIGAQICQALEGAHAIPIIHRDLKPANILVGANDLVKVVDFGIAKSLSPDTLSSTMTNADVILGTPSFMPPEMARASPCDERADLYSLGCVLYLAASGKLPFESADLPSMMLKHAMDPVPPPVDVPPALANVIYKLLEKDPKDRYQTAVATRLALEAALSAGTSSPSRLEATTVHYPVAALPTPPSGSGRGVVAAVAPREPASVTRAMTMSRTAKLLFVVAAAVLAVALVGAIAIKMTSSSTSPAPVGHAGTVDVPSATLPPPTLPPITKPRTPTVPTVPPSTSPSESASTGGALPAATKSVSKSAKRPAVTKSVPKQPITTGTKPPLRPGEDPPPF